MQPSEFTGLQTARNRLHLHNDDLDEHGTNPPPHTHTLATTTLCSSPCDMVPGIVALGNTGE